jgi:hypothetical protein
MGLFICDKLGIVLALCEIEKNILQKTKNTGKDQKVYLYIKIATPIK